MRPEKDAKRAVALRENLMKRKAQKQERLDPKQDEPKKDPHEHR